MRAKFRVEREFTRFGAGLGSIVIAEEDEAAAWIRGTTAGANREEVSGGHLRAPQRFAAIAQRLGDMDARHRLFVVKVG